MTEELGTPSLYDALLAETMWEYLMKVRTVPKCCREGGKTQDCLSAIKTIKFSYVYYLAHNILHCLPCN